MESDQTVRTYRQGHDRFYVRLEKIRGRIDEALDELASQGPSAAILVRLDRLQGELAGLAQENLGELATFIEYLHKAEEARSRAFMAEKKSTRTTRDQAQIQELSEELTKQLRLERVDGAIKELIDFLADTEFFAAHATTGRKRKLRALQTALDKSLAK